MRRNQDAFNKKKNRIVESREIACDLRSTVYIRFDLINFKDYIAADLLPKGKKGEKSPEMG